MSTLSAKDVIDWAGELENNQETKAYIEFMKDRERLVTMKLTAMLTDEIKKAGNWAELPSPTLWFLGAAKRAKWLTFDTHLTVFNRDGNTQDDRDKADELEKRAVLILGQLNDGQRWFTDMYWHLLLSSYSVNILHCGEDNLEDDYQFPYWVETPDPKTCFFPIQGGAFVPGCLARKYSMTVKEIEKKYSGKTPDGQYLVFNADGKKWAKYGDDKEARAMLEANRSGKDGLRSVEFVWLADGENVYHVAKGIDGEPDEVMQQVEERTGGVPAVVAPGTTTPIRGDGEMMGERLAPLLRPILAAVHGLNELRAYRVTMSNRVTNPTPVVQRDNPAQVDAEAQAGGAANQARPSIAKPGDWWMVNGEMSQLPGQMNPDLDKLEQSWNDELQFYVNAHMDINQPEDYSRSTANAQLQQVEARSRLDSEAISNADFAKKKILEMVLQANKSYQDHAEGEPGKVFRLRAAKDTRYGQGKKIKSGESLDVKREDYDFNYEINVETESVTQQERRLRTEIAYEDYAIRGLRTKDQVLETLFDDPGEQDELLAIDAGIRHLEGPLGAFSEEKLNALAVDLAWLEGGVIIPMGQPGMDGAMGAEVSGAGGPDVSPPEPMSAPTVNGSNAGAVGTATG